MKFIVNTNSIFLCNWLYNFFRIRQIDEQHAQIPLQILFVVHWTIENLPEYLHSVDRQAEDMYYVLYAKLSQNPLYKRTDEFMEDYCRFTALQHAIEEEILNEIIYVEVAV